MLNINLVFRLQMKQESNCELVSWKWVRHSWYFSSQFTVSGKIVRYCTSLRIVMSPVIIPKALAIYFCLHYLSGQTRLYSLYVSPSSLVENQYLAFSIRY
jgi:hypothetical protein